MEPQRAPATGEAPVSHSALPDEPGAPVFEFDFELSAEDVVLFGEHLSLSGPFYLAQMERARRLLMAVCLAALAIFALLERDVAATVIMAFALGIVAMVMWVSWPKRWRSAIRKQSQRQAAMEDSSAMLGAKRYRVDKEGLSFSGLYSGGYALWPAIVRVSSDENAAYLHISQASAHILPRRAFASEEQFSAFLAWAEVWRAASLAALSTTSST